EEIKMYEDSPDNHVHDLLSTAAYGNHSLGKAILGTDEHLQSFSKEHLHAYKDEYYTANNVVVSIAGNVDHTFIKQVEQYFNRFPQTHKEIIHDKPTFQAGTIIKNRTTEQAHLCLGYEGLSIDDEDIPTLMIINSIFGGGMSSRLFQEIREKRGLAYAVFSYHSTFLDSGLLTVYAGTNKNQLPLLEETIQQTAQNLLNHGLTEKEFTNNKEKLKGNLMLGLESTTSRMRRNGRNELLLKKHRSLDDVIREVDEVNEDRINNVIQQIFNKNHAKALIMPTKERSEEH